MENYSKNLNHALVTSMVSFSRFLRENKYVVPPTANIMFFDMVGQLDIVNMQEYRYIAKSIYCKTKLEYECFDCLFDDFFFKGYAGTMKGTLEKMLSESESEIEALEKELTKHIKSIDLKLRKKLQKIMKELLDSKPNYIKVHKRDFNKLSEEAKEELKMLIDEVCKSKKEKEILDGVFNLESENMSKKISKGDLDKAVVYDVLEQLMIANLDKKNIEELNDMIVRATETFNKTYEEYNKVRQEVAADYESEEKKIRTEYKEKLLNKSKEIQKVKIKKETLNHRDEFVGGSSAVIELLKSEDKVVSSLSESEYNSLIYYIKLNSSKFRTRLGRSMRKHKNAVIDMRKTVQEGMKYGGTPVKIYYKKPVVKKYKLVCVLDISGSVSKYLKVLSSFLFEINSVFNGGVEVYGFVNDLIDFTEVFRTNTIDEAINTVRGHRGYSSYEKAIEDFYSSCFKKIDGNTIVLYFGDARNNKNRSNVELLEEINKKVKYSVWLNPEERKKWNTGDSIADIYSQTTNATYEVNTFKQLIGFLNNFSIEKQTISN